MKRSAVLGLLLLTAGLVLALVLVQRFQRSVAVNFYLTADTQGFLVPCGCKVVPAGGLARRVSALQALERLAGNEPVIPVEATHGFADRGPGKEILNREMGRFYASTGTLVGLGGYDLLLGPEALRMAAPGVPLYLAGREPYRGSKAFRLGGWGVPPLGARGGLLRLVFLAQTPPGGATLRDPMEVMAEEVRLHPADRYMVVGQLAPPTTAALLDAFPKILVVAVQWGTDVTTIPQQRKGQWILYLGDRGRRGASVRVAWSGGQWEVLPMIRYLGPEVPSDPATAAQVAQVLKAVDAVNARALAALASADKARGGYTGSARCASCHADAHRVWSISPHARATSDLAIDHQQSNPDCLVCHATGLGKPGGYPRPDLDLSGVQCEACHGPSEGHPPRPLEMLPPSQASCGTCHTPRDSPLFDARGYWQLIKHK